MAGTGTGVREPRRRGKGNGKGGTVWQVPALQVGTESLAPRRALVRAARAHEEDRRCGQAGRRGGGSARRGNDGTAGAAAVRGAVRSGESRDRGRTAVVAAAGAQAGTGPTQGVRDRRCGAAGPPGGRRGGRECTA